MQKMIENYNFYEMEAMKYYAPAASWTIEKRKSIVTDRIFSGEWYGSEKKDGYFSKILKDEDGNIYFQSRSRGVNGDFPNKVEWLPHLNSFFEALPNGTCLLGECYLPSKPGSRNITSILGCLKEKAISRQSKEKLHLYIFDILAFNNKSFLKTKALDRFNFLLQLEKQYINEFVSYAHYSTGKELWNNLQKYLADGKEGIVITHKNALYEPGKRSSKITLKIKKELQDTVDCFFTGRATAPTKDYSGKEIETWSYWYNVKTDERLPEGNHLYEREFEHKPYAPCTKPYYFHWAGSLEIGVMKNGSIYPIGSLSGLTDEIKANYRNYKGRCIEVAAMEKFEDTQALRHGKMIGFRDDLTVNDCTWEKYVGEKG